MENEIMIQLNVELAHAGEETALSPAMLLLEKLRITPEKELPPMEFLFWHTRRSHHLPRSPLLKPPSPSYFRSPLRGTPI